MNCESWGDIDSCFGTHNESLSTRCDGQGLTIFFGMAKAVHSPQIGPARIEPYAVEELQGTAPR
jgi:hypothetical protein